LKSIYNSQSTFSGDARFCLDVSVFVQHHAHPEKPPGTGYPDQEIPGQHSNTCGIPHSPLMDHKQTLDISSEKMQPFSCFCRITDEPERIVAFELLGR